MKILLLWVCHKASFSQKFKNSETNRKRFGVWDQVPAIKVKVCGIWFCLLISCISGTATACEDHSDRNGLRFSAVRGWNKNCWRTTLRFYLPKLTLLFVLSKITLDDTLLHPHIEQKWRHWILWYRRCHLVPSDSPGHFTACGIFIISVWPAWGQSQIKT